MTKKINRLEVIEDLLDKVVQTVDTGFKKKKQITAAEMLVQLDILTKVSVIQKNLAIDPEGGEDDFENPYEDLPKDKLIEAARAEKAKRDSSGVV